MVATKASLIAAFGILSQHDRIEFSSAFQTQRVYPYANCCRAAILHTKLLVFGANNLVEDSGMTTDEKASPMTTLNFVGTTVAKSEPAAVDESRSLHEFFALPHTASLILRGSKDNQIKKVENIDAELFQQYEQNCAELNASMPTSADQLYDVTIPGIKFPGLQVMSVVTIGVKIISTSYFPSYQLVLIRDSNYAIGNRLFCWFFNRVTGKSTINKKASSSKNIQTTFSINRISVVPKENGMISFEANANLSVFLRFPSFLMKAIPGASKENFELTGGEFLQKALEDDLPVALEGFRNEYVRWLSEGRE